MTAGGAGATDQSARSAAIKRLGGFELLAKVGQGGMGSVFKARQISLDRVVAVKVLPPSIAQKDPVFIERFIREARTSAKLNHQNIVQGIEVGQDEATKLYYFAMEFVDGPTVKMVLKQEKRIAEKRALEIVAGVTQALICAQKAGIVHRDIKPDNILLTTKGEVKLADLGLARGCLDANLDEGSEGKKASSSSTNPTITNSGTAIGTPHYMAPEQIRGEIDKFDVRTDLYALGATLFHMVTGRPPYIGEKAGPIMNQHLSAPIPNPREFCPELSTPTSSLIVRLLQKDPAKRFQSANDLAVALNSAFKGERIPGDKTTGKRTPIKPHVPVPAETPSVPQQKSNVGLYAAIAVVLVVVIGAIMYKQSTSKPTTQANLIKAPVTPVAPVKAPEKPQPPPVVIPDKPPETTQVKAPVPAVAETPEFNPKNGGVPPGVPGVPRPLGDDNTTKVSMPPPATPEPQKVVKAPEPQPEPAVKKKDEPPLEQQVQQCIAQPLEKLDIAAARAKVKDLATEKKFEAQQVTAANAALDSAIETRSKEFAGQIEDLIGAGKLDDAQKQLELVKFSEGNDVSAAETAAKGLIGAEREKIAVGRTLIGLRAAMKQAADVDSVLLGVSAALDAGHIDQAAKWVDEALKDPNLAPSADFFKREKKLLTWYADLDRAVLKGAQELSDHRNFTLTLNDGRLLRIGRNTDLKFMTAYDGALTLEQRIGRGTAKLPVKLETLTRDTRYELSMLGNPDDKTDGAVLRLKWAYADLSSMTAITSKSAGILERAEKLIADAQAGDVPASDLAAIQPWVTRAQSRVRMPQKTSKGVKNPLLPYLPFINVVSAGASAGSHVKIALNGQTVLDGNAERRGLNVVAINGDKMLLHDTYDTSSNPAASKAFAQALAALPKNTLVLVAVSDDASKNFQDAAYLALRSLGARIALQGKPYHYSYYCIGMTGLDDGLAMEDMGSGLLEFPKAAAKR